jgi:hypothetical protein
MLSVRRGWSKLEEELIAALPDVPVPAAPWSPVPWMMVRDPGLFLRRLNHDVEQGFNGPRSKTGAILYDLLLVNGRIGELNVADTIGTTFAACARSDDQAVPKHKKKVVYSARTGWAEAERVLLAAKGLQADPVQGIKKAEPPPPRKLRTRMIPYPF